MKHTYLLLINLLLILTLSAQLQTDNKMKSRLDSSVQAAIDSFFADGCHVGLSLAVYNKGQLSFYNYGSVSKESSRLPTVHSVYEIGSLTKTFTGCLFAKAVMENKLRLDDDIRKYLKIPYPNLEYNGVPITARQLSTHQSSLLNSLPDNSELFKQPDFDRLPFQLIALEKDYDNKRYREELHLVNPDTIPGSVYFKYSNIGIKLLAFILEDVYQQSYEQLVRKYIMSPLKMNRTVLSVKDSTQLVKGYNPGGKPMPYVLDNAGAAGGIRSTTNDMAMFLKWQMNENDAWVKESHSLLQGDLFYYARGYNWNMELKNGRKKIWQSGGTFGMSSAMIMYPHEKLGFVLLANDACMDTQGKLSIIAETVLKEMGF
jgi:D-alanyl-D-alanine-carboxypeptidase/D-alanyl-D-alanine-endopeptidase